MITNSRPPLNNAVRIATACCMIISEEVKFQHRIPGEVPFGVTGSYQYSNFSELGVAAYDTGRISEDASRPRDAAPKVRYCANDPLSTGIRSTEESGSGSC